MSFNAHWAFIKTKFAQRFSYRVDFLLGLFAFFISNLIGPAFVGALTYAGASFPDWTFSQVILLQGVATLIHGFSYMTFFGILWNTNSRIRKGDLDLLLVRPIPALWMLIMDSFDEEDIGQLFAGVVLLSVGFSLNNVQNILPALGIMLAGILCYVCLALLASAAIIRFMPTERYYEFVYAFSLLAAYPGTIYGKTLRGAFTFVLPLFLVGFFPASVLLGIPVVGLGWALLSITLLTLFCLWLWHQALKYYSGAGG